ncbi:hypothetical protein KJ782_06625 [Patescibacteria group bacterium]|nr:hypothetical protein [Patescibacteria group bacterium]
MSKTIRIIPFFNLVLVLSIVYLKIVYGSMHWLLQKLLKYCDMPSELSTQYVGNIDSIYRLTMLLGIISIFIALISIKAKICNYILGIIILIIAICAFIFSVFPM